MVARRAPAVSALFACLLAFCTLPAAATAPAWLASPPRRGSSSSGTRVLLAQRHGTRWLRLRGGGSDASSVEVEDISDEVPATDMSDTEYESEAEAEAEAEQSDDLFVGDATTKPAKAAASGNPASPPFPWQGIFQMAKSMAISTLAMRVVKKLDPSKPACVRIARIIYASYLVIYQIVLAYMRIKVARENDQTEVVIPPPTKLLGTLSKAAGGAGPAADCAGSSGGARPEAQQLEDMAAKLLTRKIPAKAYDMARIDTMRQQLVGTSIVMALLHLKMHMIKPIVLGAAMGLWTMLESPVFKIHVLGMKAQGRLQRPFTADASLNDWLKNKSDLAQKLQAEKEAAAAAAAGEAEGADKEEEGPGGSEGGGDADQGGEGGEAWESDAASEDAGLEDGETSE